MGMDGLTTFTTVGHKAGLSAVTAAVAAGLDCDCPVVCAVVGVGGDLIALLRAEGAPLASTKIAQDKAYSASSFRVPTTTLYELVATSPALSMGITVQPGIAMYGGGLPIEFNGEVVGAIGVSGGSEDQDVDFANAGLAAIRAREFHDGH